MRKAARLIREGLTLESVAEGVGYPGAKILGGAFKTYCGIPPKRYRTLIIHP